MSIRVLLDQSSSVIEYSFDLKSVSPNDLLGNAQKQIILDVENERETLAPEFPQKEMNPDIQALIDIIKAQPPCGASFILNSSIQLLVVSLLVSWSFW